VSARAPLARGEQGTRADRPRSRRPTRVRLPLRFDALLATTAVVYVGPLVPWRSSGLSSGRAAALRALAALWRAFQASTQTRHRQPVSQAGGPRGSRGQPARGVVHDSTLRPMLTEPLTIMTVSG
jgi:hypothetical protein